MNVFTSISFFTYFYADICPNMKSVDRPPLNPKRITIESSQECFSVDIPRAAALRESANPSVASSRPQRRKRPAVCGRPPSSLPQDEDDDDDFMPPKKKPNVSVLTKQLRSSPRLSRPDASDLKKCVKKVVTKNKKVMASPCQVSLLTIAPFMHHNCYDLYNHGSIYAYIWTIYGFIMSQNPNSICPHLQNSTIMHMLSFS